MKKRQGTRSSQQTILTNMDCGENYRTGREKGETQKYRRAEDKRNTSATLA